MTMLTGIQNDFGGFDPKFSGITLRFQEHYAFELYAQMCSIDRNPEHVLELGNKALKDQDRSVAFTTFSIGTTQLHELRHFHDSLLTPFGNHIFRLRTHAAINGTQLGQRVSQERKHIMVPFSRWKTSSENRLKDVIRSCGLNADAEDDLSFPLLENDWGSAYQEIQKAYQTIDNLIYSDATEKLGFSIQPSHLFEASAILAQIQNVYSVFGEDHERVFSERIFGDPSLGKYTVVLKLLHGLFLEKQWPNESRFWSEIIHWSLFGDFEADGWNACPVNRFLRLFEHLSKLDKYPQQASAMDSFQAWDELFRLSPVIPSLKKALATNTRIFNNLKEEIGEVIAFRELFSVFERRINAQAYMLHAIANDLSQYVWPYDYQDNAEKWVAAPIKMQFQGYGLNAELPNIEELFDVRKSIKVDSEAEAITEALLRAQTVGVEFFDSSGAADINDMFAVSDYYFRTTFRDEKDFDIVRQALRESGLQTLELLW